MFESSDGMKAGIGTYAREKIKCQPQIWSGLLLPHVTTLVSAQTWIDVGVMIPDQTRDSGSLSRALA
jgi:hypothetical protein